MNSITLCSLLACLASVGIAKADPPSDPIFTTVRITCEGDREVCYSYRDDNGNIVSLGGTPKLVLVNGEQQRACGAGESHASAVFVNTPGGSTGGQGFVGVQACVDPVTRTGIVWTGPETVVYDTYGDWLNAITGH